jgi:beta-glucosidase
MATRRPDHVDPPDPPLSDGTVTLRPMRESDLLAFEIGIRDGDPAGVMCSYNRVNGDYACESQYLLTDVLKKEWKFPGFVLSDWGAAHSIAKASAAGMDHEQPNEYFYGDALKKAVEVDPRRHLLPFGR